MLVGIVFVLAYGFVYVLQAMGVDYQNHHEVALTIVAFLILAVNIPFWGYVLVVQPIKGLLARQS